MQTVICTLIELCSMKSFSIWSFLFFVTYPPTLAFRQEGEMGSPPWQAGGFGRATCHLHPPVNINALLPTLHQLARRWAPPLATIKYGMTRLM